MTFQPGDVVLTGTPPGVGCFRKPPLYLKASQIDSSVWSRTMLSRVFVAVLCLN